MLDIRELAAGYNGKTVARIAALQLMPAACCFITGASGSGKTTLLQAIAGITPATGQVLLDGTDILSLSAPARDRFRGAHIGMVFQRVHLVKSLRVIENLMLAPYLAGQAQRVAVARALMNKPKLLIADEPTASLDDDAAKMTIELLRTLAAEQGAALMIATHDARIRAANDHVITIGGAA